MLTITRRRNNEIISKYHSGVTTTALAEEYSLTSRGIQYILNNNGVAMRKQGRPIERRINESFFSTWTNEMAYVLGFVITDGNISGNTLSISQNERYILERINYVMESDYKITGRNNGKNDIHTLSIYRKRIVDDLKSLGVYDAKSRDVRMPDMPIEYMLHFIRGVIDGDGWVQDRGYVMNVTNASKSFAESLHEIFNDRGLNGRITKQGSAYRVWVSGKQDVIDLAEWIYEDAGNLYLERKRERFYVNCEKEKTPA